MLCPCGLERSARTSYYLNSAITRCVASADWCAWRAMASSRAVASSCCAAACVDIAFGLRSLLRSIASPRLDPAAGLDSPGSAPARERQRGLRRVAGFSTSSTRSNARRRVHASVGRRGTRAPSDLSRSRSRPTELRGTRGTRTPDFAACRSSRARCPGARAPESPMTRWGTKAPSDPQPAAPS